MEAALLSQRVPFKTEPATVLSSPLKVAILVICLSKSYDDSFIHLKRHWVLKH